jgi:urease accessory protein
LYMGLSIRSGCLGGAPGVADIAVPFVEIGITLSVVVLGAVVAFNVKAPVAAAMGLVGLFAIFHGHAHGAEIPEDAGGITCAAGFMIARACCILRIGCGFPIGGAGDRYGSFLVQNAGGFVTVAGLGPSYQHPLTRGSRSPIAMINILDPGV